MNMHKSGQTRFSGFVPSVGAGMGSDNPHEAYSLAAAVCAIGFFLRILLSAPVLNILGIDYGGEDVSIFGKIHPGDYVIFLSFLILIFDRGNPLENLIRIATQQTAYFAFFVIYILLIIYWGLRGPKGIGLIFDVHIIAPMTAIVFCYAPKSYCRAIAYLFVGIAVLNSLVGIVESATHMRLFPFNPEWEVLNQDYFRASAFIGHPLANAVFTSIALFVILGMRMPMLLKSAIFLIMLASLIAFGGRSALIQTVVGLAVLGVIQVRAHLSSGRMTVMQLLLGVGAVLLVPLVCFGLLYTVLHSGMGERLLAYRSLNDDSADVRFLAFDVFDHMSLPDIIFGNDGEHTLQIADQIGAKNPTSDIENPWILMFMFLGAIMFPLWLCGWAGYVWRLMAGASPALKLAVFEYFAIATTSNSFGRKDLVYGMLAGIVVCAKRIQASSADANGQPSTRMD